MSRNGTTDNPTPGTAPITARITARQAFNGSRSVTDVSPEARPGTVKSCVHGFGSIITIPNPPTTASQDSLIPNLQDRLAGAVTDQLEPGKRAAPFVVSRLMHTGVPPDA